MIISVEKQIKLQDLLKGYSAIVYLPDGHVELWRNRDGVSVFVDWQTGNIKHLQERKEWNILKGYSFKFYLTQFEEVWRDYSGATVFVNWKKGTIKRLQEENGIVIL